MSNILNKILLSILYAIFLFPFVIRLYYISHGLDFSDECWSLILWRDKPNNMIDNQYYLLFGNMLGDNPIVLRLANLFLQVFGQIIFVLGLYIFYQKHYPNNGTKIYLYIALAICSLGWPAFPTMFYVSINFWVTCLSIGLMLVGIEKEWMWALLLSGICAMSLFANMFTNVVLIPAIFIYIFYSTSNKNGGSCKNPLRSLSIFIIGCLIYLFIYSLTVHSPLEYLSMFIDKSKEVINRGTMDYGLGFMFSWSKHAAVVYFHFFVLAGAILYFYHWISQQNISKHYEIIIGLVFLLLLFLYYKKALYGYNSFWWILIFILLLNRKFDDVSILGLLLLFVPYALSLGTNVTFENRGLGYSFFLLPYCVMLLNEDQKYKWIRLFAYIWIIIGIFFFIQKIDKPRFGDFVLSECTTSIQPIGSTSKIYITAEQAEKVYAIDTILDGCDYVLCNARNWWVPYLLQKNPTKYTYFLNQNEINNFLNMVACDANNKYAVVISNENTFNENNILYNKMLGDSEYSDKILLDENIIYLYN